MKGPDRKCIALGLIALVRRLIPRCSADDVLDVLSIAESEMKRERVCGDIAASFHAAAFKRDSNACLDEAAALARHGQILGQEL